MWQYFAIKLIYCNKATTTSSLFYSCYLSSTLCTASGGWNTKILMTQTQTKHKRVHHFYLSLLLSIVRLVFFSKALWYLSQSHVICHHSEGFANEDTWLEGKKSPWASNATWQSSASFLQKQQTYSLKRSLYSPSEVVKSLSVVSVFV